MHKNYQLKLYISSHTFILCFCFSDRKWQIWIETKHPIFELDHSLNQPSSNCGGTLMLWKYNEIQWNLLPTQNTSPQRERREQVCCWMNIQPERPWDGPGSFFSHCKDLHAFRKDRKRNSEGERWGSLLGSTGRTKPLIFHCVCSYSEMFSERFTNSGARPLHRDSELPPHWVV